MNSTNDEEQRSLEKRGMQLAFGIRPQSAALGQEPGAHPNLLLQDLMQLHNLPFYSAPPPLQVASEERDSLVLQGNHSVDTQAGPCGVKYDFNSSTMLHSCYQVHWVGGLHQRREGKNSLSASGEGHNHRR